MAELDYEAFRSALARYWVSTPVAQCYMVASKKEQKVIGPTFEAKSLKECLKKYSWNGNDYTSTSATLIQLSHRLHQAVECGNNFEVKQISYEIYKWGGVPLRKKAGKPNKSATWFENNESKTLIKKLTDSVEALTTGRDLARFDGSDLIMNSGFTKVASLAATGDALIIMDGRVGAALGDLALVAMEEGGFSSISQDIIFPWGEKKSKLREVRGKETRNPSSSRVIFPRLFGTKTDYTHARAMCVASRLVREVVAELTASALELNERQFECALFMWGYDVRSRRAVRCP